MRMKEKSPEGNIGHVYPETSEGLKYLLLNYSSFYCGSLGCYNTFRFRLENVLTRTTLKGAKHKIFFLTLDTAMTL